jgi:hypothetical protein
MRASLPVLVLGSLAMAIGCGGTDPGGFAPVGGRDAGSTVDPDAGLFIPPDPNTDDGGGPDLGGPITTCAQAAAAKAYVGCDFWPTPVANAVWSIFDFAAVVANTGASPVSVSVTGPNGFNQTVTVAAGALEKIYLPWVPSVKGPDSDNCGSSGFPTASVVARASAYHLVTDKPVTVYQFNALEYRGAGGPSGKSWAACPGNTNCIDPIDGTNYGKVGCFSFSNDASLLLPSTAMTGNYRVLGAADDSGYVAITATTNRTTVDVKLGARGAILAGGGVAAAAAGGTVRLTLNAGDVVELFSKSRPFSPTSAPTPDLSGTVVSADQPVQVITGTPCTSLPAPSSWPPPLSYNLSCDHIEESVFPAETLGKDYVVTVPTGPKGSPVGHIVRLVGNVDGTTLAYSSNRPANAPSTLNAGQVVDLGRVNSDFRITGDKAFGIVSLQLSAGIVDSNAITEAKGDPSMSFPTAIEQYRDSYIFLAPSDYDQSLVDVVFTPDAEASLRLDGAQVGGTAVDIAGSGYKVKRVRLGAGASNGAHTLTADKPVGIQVIGYGSYTSYQYPGGLNLKRIAPPPIR